LINNAQFDSIVEMDVIKKKKTVSFSQFTNWWVCPHKWYRDVVLKEKVFEDSIHMSFGTGIHEAIQLYLETLYKVGEKEAEAIDVVKTFTDGFKREVTKKAIKHTQAEFDEFVEDGKGILAEFKAPENRCRYFPKDKYELLGIESQMDETIVNNVNLTCRLDMVLREKLSGDIRIIDFKTATREWNASQREDFTKTSQLVLYKAVYSKKYSLPLNKIHVEFIILRRKLYDNAQYEQSRIQIVKPSSYQKDVIQVISEFRNFVEKCFTTEGEHNVNGKFPKIPGKSKKNCKYCAYLKNGKCDGVADKVVIT
jgi:hypothetical protein